MSDSASSGQGNGRLITFKGQIPPLRRFGMTEGDIGASVAG